MEEKKTNNTKIAVYGTLRKGFGNSFYLGASPLVGTGLTVEKYKLTARGIPFVDPSEAVHRVTVEVYDVSEQQLPIVDSLEGYNPNNHDGSWYKRTPIEVELENGEVVTASIYFNEESTGTLIESGDYKEYRR